MTKEELYNIIKLNLSMPEGKYNNGNKCDKTIKQTVINQIKAYAQDENLTFTLDESNDKNEFARVDILFTMNNVKYAIELKTRPSNKHTDYNDVMFEQDKLDVLKQYITSGYNSYFLNVWADDYYQMYDISKITDDEIRKDKSYQYKTTQFNKYEHKEYIDKIFLPTKSPSLISEGDLYGRNN